MDAGPTCSQASLEAESRGLKTGTSFIYGATSLRNVNFENCTVIHEQLNIHSDDSSPAKENNIWFKMREPIASYTGRQDKLTRVHNLFFLTKKENKPTNQQEPIHQIAIVGLGGVGKSEFARKFAKLYYIHTKYYRQLDGNVVWINAGSAQLLIDSFTELATRIGIKFADLSRKTEILRMVDQVYGYFGEKKSLFIFDNVVDWADGENAVKDYLPIRMAPVKKPFVLMTSRIRTRGIKVIDLSVLTAAETVELIKARLEVKEVHGQCFHLMYKLANLLGCLPLALQQASSYIVQEMESDISGKQPNEVLASCIETYIKMFEVETEKLLDYKPSEMDVNFEEFKTTLLTWRITLEKIQGLNPGAIQLLEMMSYISPDGVDLQMFEAEFTNNGLKSAVNTLVLFSMITKNFKNSNIVSVHRLVQTVVRLDNGENQEENKPLESVLNLLNVILKEVPDILTPYTSSCAIHAQMAWKHAIAYPKLLKRFRSWKFLLRSILSCTGREDKLTEVYNLYFPTNKGIKPIHQIAIIGLGGVGKSEFAMKFARKYYTEFNENVKWINAESAQVLIESFKELAIRIGVKSTALSGKAEIFRMVDQVYRYFREKKSLFIFDNVVGWSDGKDAIKNYLPSRTAQDADTPFVLMTSRSRPSGIRVIELPVLEMAEAVALIKTRLDVKEVECVELLVQLANLHDCLPLALQQACSYIKQEMESDISGKQQNEILVSCIETYINMFEVEAKKLLDYQSKPIKMKVNYFEEMRTTPLAWRITMEKIQDVYPGATRLLEMISYISPDDIHLEMFEAEFTNDGLKSAVNTLVWFKMIKKNFKNSNIVSVHRLVQTVVRLDNGDKQEGNKPLESVLNVLNVILKKVPDILTPYTTSCVIHAQVAWEHAIAHPKLLKRFEDYPSNLCNKAELNGMYQTMLPLLQRTLAKYKDYKIYKESDEQYIAVQQLIVGALVYLHRYEDAKSLCKLIHKTAVDELGESHPFTLAILNNLALAESGLGNYSEQMGILEKIIAIRTATANIGPYHKDTLVFLNSKAECLANMEKYNEALELFKSTLELKNRHHPEDRASINETRYWIALTTQRQGNFAEALQMFRNLHTELVKYFGESHRDTLRCARGIGECLLSLGRHEVAMETLKYNMELANENPGAGLECVNTDHSIARVLLIMGRFDEAISRFRFVMNEQLRIYGETHPEVLTTREQLADVLLSAGRAGEALEHYKFVYENRVKILGADHPDTVKVKVSIDKMKK